jgi:hypothetical protein
VAAGSLPKPPARQVTNPAQREPHPPHQSASPVDVPSRSELFQ